MSFLETMFCDSIYHSTLSNEKIKKQLVKIVYDLEENVESNFYYYKEGKHYKVYLIYKAKRTIQKNE